MANVELDTTIRDKLKDVFGVDDSEIDKILDLFNSEIKPVIKKHYLSHLVASIEEMINNRKKQYFLTQFKQLDSDRDAQEIERLRKMIRQERIFTISLVAVPNNIKKARTYRKAGGVFICYADYLTDTERRFAIAHELGHIVNSYILNNDNDNQENKASLFAYIALLDKNNFYNNPTIENMLQKVENDLLHNKVTPFVAATKLLDTYKNVLINQSKK